MGILLFIDQAYFQWPPWIPPLLSVSVHVCRFRFPPLPTEHLSVQINNSQVTV